ncbi:MAG: PAS domain-containing protein [Ktedonobacteraceae bacterium]|nr:PAS domain-containing protein [Ktedonobacteraceae bacterium]
MDSFHVPFSKLDRPVSSSRRLDSDRWGTFQPEHIQLAIEASQVGMWERYLPPHSRLNWSEQCKRIFGVPVNEEVTLERFISILHPDDREPYQAYLQQMYARHEGKYSYQYRVVWPDGSIHWVEVRGRCFYDETGQPVRLIGVALDMTERKQAEALQREAERQVAEILDSMTDNFLRLDREYRLTFANTRVMIMGKITEEAIGRCIWEMLPELKGSILEQQCRLVMSTRQSTHYGAYYAPNDKWYEMHIYPAQDGGIAVYYHDLTDLVHSVQQLKVLVKTLDHKRAQLQALIEQAPSGIVLVEAPSGKVLLYNEAAEQLLTHPPLPSEDYHGYQQYWGIHADGTPYRAEEYPIARALLYGEVISQESLLYQRSDGTIAHLSFNAAPITDANGNRIAAVGTFVDVSSQYELERRKDVFISMAGHELRTPITSMKLSLQMVERKMGKLRRMCWSEESEQVVEQMQALLGRCLRQVEVQRFLINDLMDVSRIQADKLTLSLQPCNLVKIVGNVVEDQRALSSQRVIKYFAAPEINVVVLADEERVGQVINNYLTNALKYSAERDLVEVGVGVEGRYARVWVQDRGPGLSPEAQQRVWEQFYQVPEVEKQQSAREPSLGLGLYICRELIERQGGMVGVESKVGRGSRFWFTLPLLNERDEAAA